MKNEAQSQLILNAAFDKFRRLGIRRVSVDEIARDLRISKKTLYTHYASKEELVRACTERLRESVLPAVRDAIQQPGSVADRVLGVWQAFAEIPRSVSRDFVADLKADYPHIWTEVDTQRRAVISGMETMLRDGIERGEVWPEIHPRVAVEALLAILENVLVPEVMMRSDFSPGEALATVMTLMVRGALTEPPPRDPETLP